MRTILRVVSTMTLSGFMVSARAQEVSIPGPGLNSAIREALQKPAGALTVQDMLGLTQLNAGGRSTSRVEGLEAARNLRILDLNNSLTNFPIAINACVNCTTRYLPITPFELWIG